MPGFKIHLRLPENSSNTWKGNS